jgi:hypothetical protein
MGRLTSTRSVSPPGGSNEADGFTGGLKVRCELGRAKVLREEYQQQLLLIPSAGRVTRFGAPRFSVG